MRIASGIIVRFVTLTIISIVAGILYYVGNQVLNTIMVANNYRYLYTNNSTLINCIGVGFIICLFSYGIYLTICFWTKLNNIKLSAFVSIFSFVIIFSFFALAAPYGANFGSPYVIKNVIVFVAIALLTPFIEKRINSSFHI